jgi:ATP-dependent DNA helicase UvrD/PcrA
MSISRSEKLESILCNNGYLLITGGPGSGKTTAALLKAKEEMSGLEEFQKILFLSFSNSAIYQIRQTAGVHLAKEEKKHIRIQTYHSFCFMLLRSFGGTVRVPRPIDVYPQEECVTLAQRHGFTDPQQTIDFLWGQLYDTGKIPFSHFAPLVVRILKDKQILSLLQSCYPVIILDEFQDTDEDQWQIIALLGGGSRLICLADPDQQIYRFRGASPIRLDEYRKAFNPLCIDFESVNYRSGGTGITEYANALSAGQSVSAPESIDFQSFAYSTHISSRLKRAVLGMRKKLRRQKAITHPSIAILSGTNKTARVISESLQKKTATMNFSIKHRVILEEESTIHAQRVLCELLASQGRSEDHAVASILHELANYYYCLEKKTHTQRGHRLAALAEQVEKGKYPSHSKNISVKLRNSLSNLAQSITGDIEKDTHSVLNHKLFIDSTELKEIKKLMDIVNPFRSDDFIVHAANELCSKDGSYQGLKALLVRRVSQRRMSDSYRSSDGVVVMTMHKSKGKEYDGVILFHEPLQHSLLLPGDEEENRRLIKVAITRARHFVTVVHKDGAIPSVF